MYAWDLRSWGVFFITIELNIVAMVSSDLWSGLEIPISHCLFIFFIPFHTPFKSQEEEHILVLSKELEQLN